MLKNNKIKRIGFIVVFLVILMSLSVIAQSDEDIEVDYLNNKKEITFEVNKTMSTDFKVVNNRNSVAHLIIGRMIMSNEEVISYPKGNIKQVIEQYGVAYEYIEYDIALDPGKSEIFRVESIYNVIPLNNKLNLPEISVTDKDTNMIIAHANPESYFLIKCRVDGVCDTDLYENSKNCPQDCKSGLKDGICDIKKDGRMDPDCRVKSLDPDYEEDKKNILEKIWHFIKSIFKGKEDQKRNQQGIPPPNP